MDMKSIAEKKFEKTAVFGYKIDEVDSFQIEVAKYIAELSEANKDYEKKLYTLAGKLEEYRNDEDSLRTALLGAQKLGDSIIRESKAKAEEILNDAENESEMMLQNVKKETEKAATEAIAEKNRTLKELSAQIAKEEKLLAGMQKEVSVFKSELLSTYKKHLDVISSLPEFEQEEEDTVPEPAAEETGEDVSTSESEQEEAIADEDDAPLDEQEATGIKFEVDGSFDDMDDPKSLGELVGLDLNDFDGDETNALN